MASLHICLVYLEYHRFELAFNISLNLDLNLCVLQGDSKVRSLAERSNTQKLVQVLSGLKIFNK